MTKRFAATLHVCLALLACAISNIAFAELHSNPVMNQVLKSQLGWRSMIDLLGDAAQDAAKLRAMTADLSQRIASARRRYWAAYPSGADFNAAKQELESVLRSKDYVYLQQALTGTGGVMQMLGGDIDDGIPAAATSSFDAWVAQARSNLEATGTGFNDVAKAREAITKADPAYVAYVSRRNLEEFRRAGKKPAGVTAELWRISTLGATFPIQNVPDPYGTAEEVVQQHHTFLEQCPSQVSGYLNSSVTPAACQCLHTTFKRDLDPWILWQLETKLSRDQFVKSAVSKMGIPDQVAACLTK